MIRSLFLPSLGTFLIFFLLTTSSSIAAGKPSAEVIKDGAKNSGCDYDPYQKLISMGVVSKGAQIMPSNGVGGIDVALACRLSKMFEYAGKCATITSAYRSAAKQQSMCGSGRTGCAAAGRSCHQYGLAVDISGPCLQKLRQIAPQFKLIQNPIPGDPYHFQCAEHPGPGRSSCTGPCNGGIAINPDPAMLAKINETPTSQLTNSLRDMLGLNKQPTPQQSPPAPQQALPKSQQPTQYFPSTGTTQPSSGTTGTGQSPISALSPESQQYLGVTQSGTQPHVSIADQLLQMAYGTTTSPLPQNMGTTVPVHLSSSSVGTISITTPSPTQTSQGQVTQNIPVGAIQPPQTFTSQDLAQVPLTQQAYSPPPTTIATGLDTLKNALVRMLEILRPMGIRDALQGDMHVDEYIE